MTEWVLPSLVTLLSVIIIARALRPRIVAYAGWDSGMNPVCISHVGSGTSHDQAISFCSKGGTLNVFPVYDGETAMVCEMIRQTREADRHTGLTVIKGGKDDD